MLRSPFVERVAAVEGDGDEATALVAELVSAQRQGTAHELVAAAGQSVGRVERVEPAGDVVRQIVAEAQDVLARLASLSGT